MKKLDEVSLLQDLRDKVLNSSQQFGLRVHANAGIIYRLRLPHLY
jgi:hypothetical protein